MADIFAVADMIEKMADGFAPAVMDSLGANERMFPQAVHEQLWSGFSGDDTVLEPNYDNDPYFDEEGYWKGRGADYKKWKGEITPPTSGWMLNLPPRSYHIPNLYIDGTFYSTIFAERNGDCICVKVDSADSEGIVSKWGANILRLGSTAIGYFCANIVEPAIWKHFEDCGW